MTNVIVCLGQKLNANGTIPKTLQNRLLTTITLHNSTGYMIITTGGDVSKAGISEGEIMANLLMKGGIRRDKIYKETEALNTIENARNLLPILSQLNVQELYLVTNDFHLPRSMYIFEIMFRSVGSSINMRGHSAPSNVSASSLNDLIRHEKKLMYRMEKLLEQYQVVDISRVGFDNALFQLDELLSEIEIITNRSPPISLDPDLELKEFQKLSISNMILHPNIKIQQKQYDAVCKIEFPNSQICATGFLASLHGYTGIVTINHILKDISTFEKANAIFRYQDNAHPYVAQLQPNIFFWTSELLDFAFVACTDINPKEKPIVPLCLSECIDVKQGDQICIIQHPDGKKKAKNEGNICIAREFIFGYRTHTEAGSSGSPIFVGPMLAGMHLGSVANEATLISKIIEWLEEKTGITANKPKNMNRFREMQSVTSVAAIRRNRNSVCKIIFPNNGTCASGFLASFGRYIGIMTNYQPGKAVSNCQGAKAIFKIKRNEFNFHFLPEKYFWANKNLNVAFIACNFDMINQEKIVPISLLAYKNIQKDDHIYIYYHSKGKEKIKNTISIRNVEDATFNYEMGVDDNSKGAPVFCGESLVGLHNGSSCKMAIRMTKIYECLKMTIGEINRKKGFNKKNNNEGSTGLWMENPKFTI